VIACATVSLGVYPGTARANGATMSTLGSLQPTWTRVVDETVETPGNWLMRTDAPVMEATEARPARVTFGGQLSTAPGFERSEAGITWSLGEHLAVQLNYARTIIEPLTHGNHDDGVLTRLRLGF